MDVCGEVGVGGRSVEKDSGVAVTVGVGVAVVVEIDDGVAAGCEQPVTTSTIKAMAPPVRSTTIFTEFKPSLTDNVLVLEFLEIRVMFIESRVAYVRHRCS